jgi:hypothetical protein
MRESVRWLVGKGEIERSIVILKDIAKTNGKNVCDDVYLSFEVGLASNIQLHIILQINVCNFSKQYSFQGK